MPEQLHTDRQMVGLVGLEPTTPALSRRCSNQLSYRPKSVTFKQKTAYEMAIGDWSSDVCSSDLDWGEVVTR